MEGDRISMFCPFLKGDCNTDCIFFNENGNEKDPYSCNIFDAVNMIQSFGFQERTLESYLAKIESKVNSIRSDVSTIDTHTGNIESYTDSINDKVK